MQRYGVRYVSKSLQFATIFIAACAYSVGAVAQNACQNPLYLTFETGNMEAAPAVSAVLKRQGVRATFFAANERTVQGDGSLGNFWAPWWKARAAEGHEFASNTYDRVALRGDVPGGAPYRAHPDGYANAIELVAGLKAVAPFEISVAAYPETHPDADCPQADLDNLKRKLDAGATRAITQFFFSPDSFLRFRDAAAAAGIDAPIIPGILPVSNVSQTRRMADMCGTAIPAWMVSLFDGLDDHPGARQLVAATVAAEMCRRLYAGGVRDFHFYTLNRAELSYAICHLLGLRPVSTAKDQAA